MTSNEIKVEKITKDILVDSPACSIKKVKTYDNSNFLEFMNDQMNFGNYTVKNPTAKNTDLIEEDQLQSLKEPILKSNSELISNQTNINANIIEINDAKADKKFADDYLKIDAKKLSSEDINSISSLLSNNGIVANMDYLKTYTNNMVTQHQSGLSYSSMNFSKSLYEALNKSYKKNLPIRIDFENSSSVILKIDKEGKLSAQFLASEKGMENLLKENLYSLRAKFDKEGIPYGELVYKEQKESQKNTEEE